MKYLYSLLLVFILLFGCNDEGYVPDPLVLISYTANETGSVANSTLIIGKYEVVLVDAQLLKQPAQDVVQMIRNTGKKLTRIFITHSHPDHYLGLAILQDEFPDVQILATEKVVREINNTAQGTFDALKAMFGDLMADRYIVPQVLNSTELLLEGNFLQILEYSNTESNEIAALYVPSLKAFLSSDLLYNDVFLWLVEKRPNEWIQILDQIANMDINIIYPGHGLPQGLFLINENKQYITDFIAATQEAGANAQTVIDAMKAKYPLYQGNYLLQASAEAYFPKDKE